MVNCQNVIKISLSVARACLFIETLVILVENETFSISHYEMKCDESLDTHIMTKNILPKPSWMISVSFGSVWQANSSVSVLFGFFEIFGSVVS